MVSAYDVIDIAGVLTSAGIRFWLDGGWAVDALIGRQTREHDDLDLVTLLEESDCVISTFALTGFHLIEDDRPTRFVLGDGRERRIDFHPVVFSADGSARARSAPGQTAAMPYFRRAASLALERSPGRGFPASRRSCLCAFIPATSRSRRTATTYACYASGSGCRCRRPTVSPLARKVAHRLD